MMFQRVKCIAMFKYVNEQDEYKTVIINFSIKGYESGGFEVMDIYG